MPYILDSVLSQAVDTALQFFPYTCSLLAPGTPTNDSVGGRTRGTPTTTASDVPCIFVEYRQPATRTVGPQEETLVTHVMYLPATAATVAITEEYLIEVQALNNEPVMIFNHPIRKEGAFSHLITLHCSIASLV